MLQEQQNTLQMGNNRKTGTTHHCCKCSPKWRSSKQNYVLHIFQSQFSQLSDFFIKITGFYLLLEFQNKLITLKKCYTGIQTPHMKRVFLHYSQTYSFAITCTWKWILFLFFDPALQKLRWEVELLEFIANLWGLAMQNYICFWGRDTRVRKHESNNLLPNYIAGLTTAIISEILLSVLENF